VATSKLTEKAVKCAKVRGRKYELTCGALKGFMLRVTAQGKKAYYVRYTAKNGKDVRERLGSTREIAFEEARARAQSRLELSEAEITPLQAVGSRPPRLRDFARRFIEEHVNVRLKPGSRKKYPQSINGSILPMFGKLRLDEVRRVDVIQWHSSMRSTPYQANAVLTTLSSIYGRAIEWEVLPPNFLSPTRGVRKFPTKSRERFLSPDERDRLEARLDHGLELPKNQKGALFWSTVTAIRLLAYTGMRRTEVCDLTWSMVDWRHHCLRLPESKTGKKVVPVSSATLELLRMCKERSRTKPNKWVIPNRAGGRIDPEVLTHSWVAIRNSLPGFSRVRLHDLRHSAASDALNAGVPLAVVGKILGHKKPETTARYAHISDHSLRKGVEAMGTAITGRKKGEK